MLLELFGWLPMLKKGRLLLTDELGAELEANRFKSHSFPCTMALTETPTGVEQQPRLPQLGIPKTNKEPAGYKDVD